VDVVKNVTIGPVTNLLLHKQYIYFIRVISWKYLKISSTRTTNQSVPQWYPTSN